MHDIFPAWQQALAARLKLTQGRLNVLAAIGDQGLISLANFAVALLLIRTGSKAEYGIYSLGYTTIMTVSGLTGALFSGQITVMFHQKQPIDRPGFVGALLLGQWLLSVLGCAVALLAVVMIGDEMPARTAVILTILACPAAMANEFMRDFCYLLETGPRALALDVLNTVLWLGGSLVAIHAGIAPHLAALGVYAIACLVTSLVAMAWCRVSVRHRPALVLRSMQEAWQNGRWSIGGVLVTMLQEQAHVYLLGWVGGPARVAELNAARMLMTPVALLTVGINRSLMPRLARLHADGKLEAARREAGHALWIVLLAIGFYAAPLLAMPGLVHLVLPENYDGLQHLMAGWAIVLSLRSVSWNFSARLQVAHRFRSLTILNLYTAVPVALCAVPLVMWYGAMGSVTVLGAGQAVLALLLVREMARVHQHADRHPTIRHSEIQPPLADAD
jgi:O-antigen/teichoic acid export membrane protein